MKGHLATLEWGDQLLVAISSVTRTTRGLKPRDPHAAEELLPLVYEKLRKLAAVKLAQQKPGRTSVALTAHNGAPQSPSAPTATA